MKRSFFIFVLLFGMMAAYAQDQAQEQPQANPNAPVITFDEKFMQNGIAIHDYGVITKGDNGTCYFVFTNTGKEPLIIERASSSCGCTVPNPPTYPILPGQRDSISVRYDTNRVGGIYKTVTVYSNASNNPLTMQIKGTIKDKPVEEAPAETKQ